MVQNKLVHIASLSKQNILQLVIQNHNLRVFPSLLMWALFLFELENLTEI